MNDNKMMETLCEYLDGSGLGVFMPEVWRDGAFAIFLTGKTEICKQYVNGDRVVAVEFEIRSRCPGESADDRLVVLKNYSSLADYVKKTPFPEAEVEVLMTKGAQKAKVYKDGSEEYVSTCKLIYLKRRGE